LDDDFGIIGFHSIAIDHHTRMVLGCSTVFRDIFCLRNGLGIGKVCLAAN